MSTEETTQVLYNACYGGFALSSKAVELYNLRMKQTEEGFEPPEFYFDYWCFERHDPMLLQIYKEIGKEFNGDHSSIEVKTISKKHVNYYHIKEEDGLESVSIDIGTYETDVMKDNMRAVLRNSMTNDEKIIEFNRILFD